MRGIQGKIRRLTLTPCIQTLTFISIRLDCTHHCNAGCEFKHCVNTNTDAGIRGIIKGS
jgi:hypothetical protein